ncbi:MAG TPA: FHA domain-containing protein [Candidatus Methanofastidiosum sp.]|jgi:hypothetical protein|nr:FHA domain-containing protein [Methanofastidiosum sp.]
MNQTRGGFYRVPIVVTLVSSLSILLGFVLVLASIYSSIIFSQPAMLLPVIFGVFFIVVGYFLYKGRNWSRFGEIILLAGLSIISILATTVPQLGDILGKIKYIGGLLLLPLPILGLSLVVILLLVLHKQTAQYFKYIGEVGTISYKLSDKKPSQHAPEQTLFSRPPATGGVRINQTSAQPYRRPEGSYSETIVDTGLRRPGVSMSQDDKTVVGRKVEIASNPSYILYHPQETIRVVNEIHRIFGREDFERFITPLEAQSISRKTSGGHFRITMAFNEQTEQVRYYLEDLDSSNGTKVNGIDLRKGEKVALKHSDIITVGKAMKIEFKTL